MNSSLSFLLQLVSSVFFTFRSAEYDEAAQLCRMSREDRRTQPMAFRRDGSSWDYLENQCVKSESELKLLQFFKLLYKEMMYLQLCPIVGTLVVRRAVLYCQWTRWNLLRAKPNANHFVIR